MDNDYGKETINLRGSTGKLIKIQLEELAKKKIDGKVEVVGKLYYVKLTRWYSLDQTFSNLNDAARTLVKLVQKIDKINRK
jgi:hypothetical protein